MWRKVRAAYSHELDRRLGLGKGEPRPHHAAPAFESVGRVTHVEESAGWPSLVSRLLGIDIEALENEFGCLYLQKYVYPGTVITGDVHLSGDITSEDLRLIEAEGDGDEESFGLSENEELGTGYVVVLGDLHIEGTLEVVGEYDLFVAGELHAENVISNSGNAVVSGGVHVEELVWLETSKEGGWFWAPTFNVPSMVLFIDGEGPGYRPEVSGRFVEVDRGEKEAEALVHAVAKAEEGVPLFQRVCTLVQSGKAGALSQLLEED